MATKKKPNRKPKKHTRAPQKNKTNKSRGTSPRKQKNSPKGNSTGVPSSPIDEKIRLFKAEIGNRKLTEEQSKVYHAFTKKSGSMTYINVTDKSGKKVRIKIDSTKSSRGSQYILLRHYKTNYGRVTAFEILNLCNVVKFGEPYDSQGYIVYKMNVQQSGVIYRTTLKFSVENESAALKSFYSDRGM